MVDTGVCPDCITGAIHEGAPTGTVSTIAKLPTYIAKPTSKPGKPGVIVIIPDVFGWTFVNNRLLADEYAERSGRTVYLPDFMFGDIPNHKLIDVADPIDGSQPGMFQKIGAVAQLLLLLVPFIFWHRQSVTIPIIKSFFEILRTENPDLKIGVAGFCWGGRYAILLGQADFADQPLVDACFAGHPSLLAFPKDLEKPVVPTSIAVAELDHRFDPKMGDKVKELWEKSRHDVKTEIVVYKGVKHGFCVRGDMKNEQIKDAITKAVDQALDWFNPYLSA